MTHVKSKLKILKFIVLPVTSRFPGPAWDVSTKNVTGFPTIPFLHSLTCMASTLYTLQGNGEPGTGSFPNETKIWCSPATFGQNSALKVPLEISWTCAGTDSPDGESMAISMSSTEPITFDNVKYDIFPTAVAANDCPDTMIWLGSIRKKKVQNVRKIQNHWVEPIYTYISIIVLFLTGVYFCSEWCSWHQVLIEGDIDCMIYSFHWHKADSKSCGSKRMNLRWNISTPSGYCDFQISFP